MRRAVLLLALTGCAGARDAIETGMQSARDVVVVAEPCLAEMHDADVAACNGDAKCRETVSAHWAPIADALDAFKAAWCAVSPSSEGCS